MNEGPTGTLHRGLLLPRRVLRFTSRIGFVLVAGMLLVVAGYRFTLLWFVPEVTIAVSAADLGYHALFSHLARVIDAENLKIRTLALSDAKSVADAVEQGRADFGVIRPDDVFPKNGMTAAILRELPVFVFGFTAPNSTGKASDKTALKDKKQPEADSGLAGKHVGVSEKRAADRQAIARILAFNGLTENALVKIDDDSPGGIRAAFEGGKINVWATLGRAEETRRLLASLADLQPILLPLNAAALASELPVFGQTSVPARSLSASLPAEDAQAPSVSWRLVAGRDVQRASVAALLQALFWNRLELARESALAWSIAGIGEEGDTSAKLPNHRGALDYYNREQQTFMDLYGDWLWLGLFAAGGVSSGLAWLAQVLSRRRKQLVEHILDRLLEILDEARVAETAKRLDELTLEVDGLVTHAVRQARWRATDPIATSALTLAIDSSRAAIADRRFFLREEASARAPVPGHRAGTGRRATQHDLSDTG